MCTPLCTFTAIRLYFYGIHISVGNQTEAPSRTYGRVLANGASIHVDDVVRMQHGRICLTSNAAECRLLDVLDSDDIMLQ
mmetsp:Transcript_33115/g.47907  ORF Transcript_33115/g.47907 Transcript_33115/m.47907 type:complete len:80 (-) Transcript_33115:117-356(-)